MESDIWASEDFIQWASPQWDIFISIALRFAYIWSEKVRDH